MSNPHEEGGISVTIKGDEPGGKYNDAKRPGTWIVFHGSPARVKEQIIEVFALGAEAAERPLYDVVNEATDLFKATATVSDKLGGRVLNDGKSSGSGDAWDRAKSGDSSETKAPEKSEAEVEVERLTAEVAKVTTVEDLQQLWARNQEAFKDEALMAAYKAKGKALSA